MHDRDKRNFGGPDLDTQDLKRHEPASENGDHWEMFAEATDLTIEGHRLIAQEIIYELKVLGWGVAGWMRGLLATGARRGSSTRL